MSICSGKINSHKSLMILLTSIIAAMFLNIANHSLTLAQAPSERFAGIVTDGNGMPLAAAVTINGEEVQSDNDGSFVVHVPRDENNRYRISADKVGYAPISFTHIGLAINNLELTLRQAESFVVDPAGPIHVEDGSGTRIAIPANSLVDENGVPADGPLTLYIYTYNLAEEEMPGDMSGINTDGEFVFMESVGAFHVRFVDADGNEYNLADGAVAQVSIELKDAADIDEPVTLWSFDHARGLWIEETDAVQNGNRVEGKVTHFSEWNFDIEKQTPACVKLTVDLTHWAANQPFQIKIVIPSENRTQIINVNDPINPDVLYNLPPNTDIEIYMPTNAPFPIAVVNTGAPWTGPGEPGNPLIPLFPYNGCSAQLHFDGSMAPTAGISGTKYHDQNGNGIQDAGEPGLPNWTILLQGPNGSTISTVTDANGNYSFSNLPAMTYKVAEDLKNNFGWAQTMPTTGFYTTTLVAGQTVSGLDFGNWQYQNESCVTHWDVHIPLNLPYVEFHMGIHNWTGLDHSYQIEVFPFPGLYGLTGFTTTPGLPITVLANSSESLLVRVDPKPTMDPSVTNINFQVVVTNLNTGTSFGCGGTMWNQNTNLVMFPQLGADPVPPQVQVGQPAQVGIVIQNRRLQPIEANIEVVAMFERALAPELEALARRANANHAVDVLSLNGLPAGEHFVEKIKIPAGESMDFEVDVALMEDIAGVGDIMFIIDEDGDGEEDAIASVLVHTGLFENKTTIYINPEDSLIFTSDIYTVNVEIDNIQNFYGNQLEINYDPAIVEVVDAYDFLPGVQIQHGDFLAADTVIKNIADNANGIIRYSTSLQGNKPGINGSGILAQIAFRGLISGTTPLSLTNVVLSDPQSVAIDANQESGQIVVQKLSYDISGQLALERRGINNNSGAEICVEAQCVTTDDAGSYTLNDVPANGQVEVRRQSYLSSTHAYSSTGGLITLPDLTLLGGDINQDGFINIDDGALVGQAWQSTPADAHWDVRADVTDDSKVDILDMVAVQFNWNETAPGPWSIVRAASRRSTRSVARIASVEGVYATDAEAQVAITPAFSAIKKLNGSTTVDIMAEDVTDLYAFTVVTSFDPDKVQVVDINPTETGIQIQVGDLLDPFNQFVLYNQVDNENGTLELSVTQTHPATAKSGSGVLGTVTFEAVGLDDTIVELTSATKLVDSSTPDPQDIAVAMEDSTLRIGRRIFLPTMVR